MPREPRLAEKTLKILKSSSLTSPPVLCHPDQSEKEMPEGLPFPDKGEGDKYKNPILSTPS